MTQYECGLCLLNGGGISIDLERAAYYFAFQHNTKRLIVNSIKIPVFDMAKAFRLT
jgi:hypothetical protein